MGILDRDYMRSDYEEERYRPSLKQRIRKFLRYLWWKIKECYKYLGGG